MDLVIDCHQSAQGFPKNEAYGLTSQFQRAAVSVPANIAEGRARRHTKEFVQHISRAYGSLAELETLVRIAERLEYLDATQSKGILDKTAEIGRMLNGLRRSLGSGS